MSCLHFVAPWDLDARLRVLPPPGTAPVILIESRAKSSALPYHRKKLVLVLSAMRHFAAELRAAGHHVEIVNARSYVDGLREAVARHRATSIAVMEPKEWGLSRALSEAERTGALPRIVRHDDGGEGGHFLFTRAEVRAWAAGRKELRMDHFYAFARKQTGYLMDRGKPLGGKMSFDADNRERPSHERPPPHRGSTPDAITRAVIEEVRGWGHGWGELDGFDWPVTRAEALEALERFFEQRAALFGRFQDAMITGEPYLWHTLIAPSLNLGLLAPREVCERIVASHRAGQMPLPAAEGLLRQVLGWREFVRAMYWLRMPAMRAANALGAARKLPVFYWEPERARMRCVREAVEQVKATGYAHHIQRLMVLGNFALLAGIEPLALSHWFWAAFVDAYEWVELPNVHGMALYADDGFTTKPYAASGAYIHRMSDHCRGCAYDPKKRTGPDACPFNPLFWAFLVRHRERFAGHPRLGALYRTWDRFGPAEQKAIADSAAAVLDALEPAPDVWSFHDDRC